MAGIMFRRIRGHIVPIKQKDVEKWDKRTRAAVIGGGVGVSTAGAVYAGFRKVHSDMAATYPRLLNIARTYARRASAAVGSFPEAPKGKVVDMFAMKKYRAAVEKAHQASARSLILRSKAVRFAGKSIQVQRAATLVRRAALPVALAAGVVSAVSAYIINRDAK